MRVFVYSKKTSKKIAQINNVSEVHSTVDKREITFVTGSGETFTFDTKTMKTTTYQN